MGILPKSISVYDLKLFGITPRNTIPLFSGVLPQKWYSTSGSTPKLFKIIQCNGSDINMINKFIIEKHKLDTLGSLPGKKSFLDVLLEPKLKVLGVLPELLYLLFESII